ncbi:copper resistance CopC family protein [Paenibacillus radicis (ex Gao et al. 2016)]|uniref:CopC domain-containing protein n=1 Tax=Paenibacillus radicis (ex Gao et al. 2016) TaxID=1737354 RepID=A0A917HN09_9BACL|nr:copper resistance protein CopC [Paenibacillus radicis (ex Gao et al. 2016)]GGG83833.1 hypothetical protein GCM10010918_46940 [Paenibacillus radicis (ex Gao et al. 2016)]
MRLKMMASNIFVLLAALLILFPSAAMAHSKMDSAVPGDGETVNVSPSEITMTFNTKIEKLSKFKLLNEAAEEVKTGKSVVDGNTMSGDLPEKLANGSYTVKWTIMGADGHTISGDYSFTVDAPEEAAATATPDATPVPSADPTETPAETPTEVPAVPDQASNNGNTPTTQNSDMALGPILVVAVVITVIALVAAILISRRRKG